MPAVPDRNRTGAAESGSQQEIELRRIVSVAPQMLAVMEPDGRISWLNEVALDYLGFSLADLGGDIFRAQVVHPDDLQKLHEERQRALASGLPFEGEQRVRGKDGKYRWFLVRYRPLKDEKGRVIRWYGGTMDIEDRKRSEEVLRRSEACLVEAQTLTHTGSWATDVTSGEPLYWSKISNLVLRSAGGPSGL
jgi:PAS domain S-box-containing protein